MSSIQLVSVTVVCTSLIIFAGLFLKRNKVGFYYVNRDQQQAILDEFKAFEEESKKAMDLRGNPTHECVCGSNIWNIRAMFENYEISQYFLEMDCVKCGSLATAPTPLDREKME